MPDLRRLDINGPRQPLQIGACCVQLVDQRHEQSQQVFIEVEPFGQIAEQFHPRNISLAKHCAPVGLRGHDDLLPDKGFLRQEVVSLEQFFKTENGARYEAHGRRT